MGSSSALENYINEKIPKPDSPPAVQFGLKRTILGKINEDDPRESIKNSLRELIDRKKTQSQIVDDFFRKSIFTDAEYRLNKKSAKKIQDVRYEKNSKTKSGFSPLSRSIIGDPTALEMQKELELRRKVTTGLFKNMTRSGLRTTDLNKRAKNI